MRCLVCGKDINSSHYCTRCANLVRDFESLIKDNILAAMFFLKHQGARMEMWRRVMNKRNSVTL
jgi:hypothetical protein